MSASVSRLSDEARVAAAHAEIADVLRKHECFGLIVIEAKGITGTDYCLKWHCVCDVLPLVEKFVDNL